jgi:hypothetical protein
MLVAPKGSGKGGGGKGGETGETKEEEAEFGESFEEVKGRVVAVQRAAV